MPRITKEPGERRQEILDTAMKLFYEKGYEKTSMADIATAMGVAQGLCYRYFPSKEILFDTAIDQYAQSQVDQITKVLKKPGISLVQMVEEMPTFVEAESDDSYANRFCHGPESRKIHNQLSMSICARMKPVVKAQLDAANGRGETHIEDTDAAASFCVYGQLGILLDQELPREERVRRIKTFLIGIIKKLS
ncbi:TetR/AcrR family transcriptional regulator [Qiania dongpingensis]|uniref:TetR/AcrR family transcriptional regulator n=1 Tax=Qiania dongpingensis TaxID=2763669 RepID=A0A7G9G3P0_9FIRM|nr:TetR/AcrR family transcriptional regulator [Qiania dongpingensis]QNM05422.1 TetR/AcrR family transcriptional regulator [Qiania dongpingensis]